MFFQFCFFYGPGYGLGHGLGLPWDSQGASWGFLGPQGAQKGGFRDFRGGGRGDPPLLGFPIALRGILTYMPFKGCLW